MNIELIEINKLKPATYNPRQISTKQYNDLKESIERFGLVDPIVVNQYFAENYYIVIGGHQRLKICKELGHKDIGCIVLNLNKEQERELNVRLNKSGGEFDMDILANEFDIDELVDWGFKHIDLGLNIDKIEENNYTQKIEAPIYEPKGVKPKVSELYNQDKGLELLEKIKKSKVSKAEKEFLTMATFRHTVFDYSKIAEYYAQSNKEMQELMEDSALVIIDFDKAIENGFVNLSNEIREQYLKDNPNE